MKGDARAFKKLFPKKRIPSILSALLQAGSKIQKKTENEHENQITKWLLERIILMYPFRDGPLDIRMLTKIPSGEIDLLVSCGKGFQVYFAIEAKRLRFYIPNGKFKTGNDAYVKDGMMRFVTGQYAPLMETGAMLGYVYDGKTDKARSGVAEYIRRKEKELRLREPKRLKRSEILPGKNVDETNHDLEKRSFTIYHIFLSI